MSSTDFDPRDLPIGVFDSGVGGLTVMSAITELLPHEDIIYLGDTARVPYGNRGASTVRRYALNATRLLVERGVKALVVACNTASAYALGAIKEHYDLPVFGVIQPVARTAVATSEAGSIAVIGTRGTVHSECYPTAIQQLRAGARVHQVPCPLFVPLAEEGWTSGDVPREVAASYLTELGDTDIDTLILGCTHYPLLRDTIGEVVEQAVGRPVTLLDSATSTAHTLHDTLAERELLCPAEGDGVLDFLVTDLPDGFVPTAERFFGAGIDRFEHVNIVDYEA